MSDLTSEQRVLIGAAKNEQAKLDLHLSSVGQVASARARVLLDLNRSGMSTRKIAEIIGVSHTVVAREVRKAAARQPD